MKKFIFLVLVLISLSGSLFANNYECSVVDIEDNCSADYNAGEFANTGTIDMYFFHTEGCPHCHNVEEKLKEIESEYDLNIISIDVRAEGNIKFFKDIVLELSDKDNLSYGVPKVVIGDTLLSGDKTIINNIEEVLDNCQTEECTLYSVQGEEYEVGLLEIVSLAIADSINPCALAVLLILLSAVLLKFSKKHIILYSFAFIATIFVSYFVIGIIILFGFKNLGTMLSVGTSFFMMFFAVIAIVLGILNLKDALFYGAGGFVLEVPKSWRPTMKRIIKDVTSPLSAIIIALIVSLFLLPCTAGPYFLVSGLLYNSSWIVAIGWLLVYNLIFIIPMIIITGIVYFGFSSVENLEKSRQKMIRVVHAISGIILILLGLYLLFAL